MSNDERIHITKYGLLHDKFKFFHDFPKIMSLELRWIFDGDIPKKVKKGFYKDLESIGDPKESPCEDIYLFNPEVGYA